MKDLRYLIEQTGIEAGDTAMRDLPNWHAPKKILIAALRSGQIAGAALLNVVDPDLGY
jgi:hypothetical protein